MKVKLTFEALYLIPTITGDSFCFLFLRILYRKESKNIGWITPFIAISWTGTKGLYIAWINKGINITINGIERFMYKPGEELTIKIPEPA